MNKKEKEELKKKFELKLNAKRISVETSRDVQETLENIVNKLHEEYKNGKNVYVEKYVPTKLLPYVPYKIYSCDFEGTTKKEFLREIQKIERKLENAKNIVVRNGSYGLSEKMFEDFDKGSDTVYVFDGYNNISAIFDRYDLDVRTDEDFLDYANICMMGMTIKEERQEEEKIKTKTKLKEAKRIEKIKKDIPKWIKEGNSIIYEEKQEEWKKYIEQFQDEDIIYADIVGQALEIMQCLDKTGSIDKAEKILKDQGHSGMSFAEVNEIVFKFSKKGPEFYEDVIRYVQKKEINEETERKILNQKKMNNSFAREEKRKDDYKISTTIIGKATKDVPTIEKQKANQVKNQEIEKDEKDRE